MALMFVSLGILGIDQYNSGGAEFLRGLNSALGGSNRIFPIVMAVIELLAGVLLIVSLFGIMSEGLSKILLLVVFVFWAINIALGYFLEGIFEPTFIKWLAGVSPQLVILTALWIVYRNPE